MVKGLKVSHGATLAVRRGGTTKTWRYKGAQRQGGNATRQRQRHRGIKVHGGRADEQRGEPHNKEQGFMNFERKAKQPAVIRVFEPKTPLLKS
jgi:hypothetical protein